MAEPSSSVFKFRFDAASADKKEKLNFSVLGRILGEICDYPIFWLYFPLTLIYCISFALIPALVGDIINVCVSALIAVFMNTATDFATEDIFKIGIKALGLVLLNCISGVLQGVVSASVSSRYSCRLRKDCFAKLNRLPAAFTDTYSHRSILSCMTESVDTVDQSLSLILVKVLTAVVMVPVVLIRVAFVDFDSVIICLVMITITVICTSFAEKASNKSASERYLKEYPSAEYSDELCTNLRYLRNSGRLGSTKQRISNESAGTKPAASARFLSVLPSCITEAGTDLCIIAVLVYSVLKNSYVSAGLMISLMLYIRRLFQPVSQAFAFSGVLNNASKSGKVIFSFLDEKEEYLQGNKIVPKGDIVFNNVTFAYPAGSGNVFENASFVIPSRGITALQGKTGSGKSTITKLILRFYYPQYGSITIGGVNINAFSLHDFRNRFSVITQEAALSEGTVFENLVFGTDCRDAQRVIKTCELTGADKYIRDLPQGYNTKVTSDPCNLSNGICQLIMLSRALLKDSDYIVFDEATSFVDKESEERIRQILKKLSEKRGVIIISHKKSTAAGASCVIDIENGRVKEYGNTSL